MTVYDKIRLGIGNYNCRWSGRINVVKHLPPAQDDLISILDWIAKDSPSRAVLFVDRLDERIGQLGRHPLLGRVPRNPKLREYGYRVLVVESYLVFYIVRGQTVEIHRLVHGARNLDHLI
jgi:toxin ParE1/3/4